MISATGMFAFEEGSKVMYDTDLQCVYTYNPVLEVFLCELRAVTSFDGTTIANYFLSLLKADVDAETGTGTNPSDKLLDQVEQVVMAYLDGITENSGVTFSN